MSIGSVGDTQARVERDQQGNEFVLTPRSCPTCQRGDALFLGVRGGEQQRYGMGISSRIVRCQGCQLIYPDPMPLPADPDAIYTDPAGYFRRHEQSARVREYRALVQEIRRRVGRQDVRGLDVGSGRGDFVYAAAQEGLTTVQGVEFATAMVEHAREQFGVELFHGTLGDYAATDPEPFDVVVLNAILEHVPDPDAFVETVRRLTRAGAYLYLDIPHDPNLATAVGNTVNRLRGRREVFNIAPTWPPFHLYGFNVRALRALLHKHSFEIDAVKRWNDPRIFSNGTTRDTLKATMLTTVNRIANATGSAANMYVWAQRA